MHRVPQLCICHEMADSQNESSWIIKISRQYACADVFRFVSPRSENGKCGEEILRRKSDRRCRPSQTIRFVTNPHISLLLTLHISRFVSSQQRPSRQPRCSLLNRIFVLSVAAAKSRRRRRTMALRPSHSFHLH